MHRQNNELRRGTQCRDGVNYFGGHGNQSVNNLNAMRTGTRPANEIRIRNQYFAQFSLQWTPKTAF